MSAIPLGLLSNEFPPSIWEVIFCVCDITDFPARITTVWTNVVLVIVEGTPTLKSIPHSMSQLPALRMLGIGHNHIESIPDDVLANPSLMVFDVAANPVHQLPYSTGSFDKLQLVDARGTNVSEIPFAWTQRVVSKSSPFVVLRGSNSPLCDGRAAAPSVSPLALDCTPSIGNTIPYAYAIEDEDKWRRANQ